MESNVLEKSRTASGVYHHSPITPFNRMSQVDGNLSSEATLAAATSMLVGIGLRNWLTDSEKDFLDRLGIDNKLVFLVRGNRYLHPENVELFSFDLVQAAMNQGGEAVFSHRSEPLQRDGREAGRVHTARIALIENEPVVLGMYGSDDMLSQDERGIQFFHLVEIFRNAGHTAHQMCTSLKDKTIRKPAIVVNRASGYMLYVSKEISSLLDYPVRDLVGREYSRISEDISSLISHHRMKMENLSSGDLHLSLITFEPIAAQELNVKSDDSAADGSPALNYVSTISTAASFLEANHQIISLQETRDMARIISEAATNLKRTLEYQHLIDNFNLLPGQCVDLQFEMEKAIERLSSKTASLEQIHIDCDTAQPYAVAPLNAYVHLFESILGIHLQLGGHQSSNHKIKISQPGPNCNIVISFSMNIPDDRSHEIPDQLWSPEIGKLAARLQVRIHRCDKTDTNNLVTRLIIQPQEVMSI